MTAETAKERSDRGAATGPVTGSPKNLVVNPAFSGSAGVPDGWTFVTPRDELAPDYRFDSAAKRLVLGATGDRHAFGCWRGKVALEVGKWYRAAIEVRSVDIENPRLSVFAQVAQHFLVPRGRWQEEVVLEQLFRHGNEGDGNHVEVYLRAADRGRVEFWEPRVVEVPEPRFRTARVASIRFGESGKPLTLAEQRGRIAVKLEEAGALKSDIAVLTEVCPVVGVPESEYGTFADAAESVPDGPVCRVLSAAANKHRMYVLAGIVERRGPHVFNTAVIFGRDGELVGRYDKTHLTFGELTAGISCGDSYPVFDLDFGRIGVHICYDEWFPEVARYYAHQGVEILFLPVMGGKPITWRTRALDNGCYFVSSSTNPPSMVIDSSGAIIAETHGNGIACADLNLDYRETNWYKDPTLTYGMPCIIPQLRNRLSDRLLAELQQSMSR